MPYWIHCDQQAQSGDLRRVQILTSDELSLREDLRGPFHTLTEALKIAETLIWSVVATIMDRLRTEKPRKFATFPLGEQPTEEQESALVDDARGVKDPRVFSPAPHCNGASMANDGGVRLADAAVFL